ncbi:MAG TPA: PQQ-binding-like beta-propeller repeat protein, partial [Capillimicrobium sp.]
MRVLPAVLLAALTASSAAAAAPPRGCTMAHCDPQMSDAARLPAPAAVREAWTDPAAASAAQGLGCSADGALAACTFGDRTGDRSRPYLKVYDRDGTVRWTSRAELDSWAWTSVPLILPSGDLVAADDARLVRFAPGGRVRWRARTPGGAPISPTRTADGTIVLATSGGPVSAYDPDSGRRLAALDLRGAERGVEGRFDTRNTPGARGRRVYVSTAFTRDDGAMGDRARLYAIDVRPRARPGRRLTVAWHFDFGARSGASPLVVGDLVVFDGDRAVAGAPLAPRFFAVRDRGDRPELVWEHLLGGPGVASAALDPRGGAWVFTFGQPLLRRLSLTTGRVVQEIDLDAAVGAAGTHVPLSAMTIAEGPGGGPAMLVTARAAESTHVVALDLVRGRPLWAHPLPA